MHARIGRPASLVSHRLTTWPQFCRQPAELWSALPRACTLIRAWPIAGASASLCRSTAPLLLPVCPTAVSDTVSDSRLTGYILCSSSTETRWLWGSNTTFLVRCQRSSQPGHRLSGALPQNDSPCAKHLRWAQSRWSFSNVIVCRATHLEQLPLMLASPYLFFAGRASW